jgi:hypothetical protein
VRIDGAVFSGGLVIFGKAVREGETFRGGESVRRGKLVFLAVAATVLVLAAAPAFAASGASVKSFPPSVPKAFFGTVVYSEVEGPHYELVPCAGKYCLTMSYVLQGPFDFSHYVGKNVVVFGYVQNGPSIWGKLVLKVVCLSIRKLTT